MGRRKKEITVSRVLGKALKEVKKINKITYEQMAKTFGVNYVTLYNWIKKGQEPKNTEVRKRIVDFLGWDVFDVNNIKTVKVKPIGKLNNFEKLISQYEEVAKKDLLLCKLIIPSIAALVFTSVQRMGIPCRMLISESFEVFIALNYNNNNYEIFIMGGVNHVMVAFKTPYSEELNNEKKLVKLSMNLITEFCKKIKEY